MDANYYQVIEGKPYRPSNGCEGDWFMGKWCEKCVKDTVPGGCRIIADSMAFGLDDGRYPAELRCEHFPEGFDAWCTAFVKTIPAPVGGGKEG